MRSRLLLTTGALILLAGCSSPVENAMEKQIESETGENADVDVDADGAMEVKTENGTFVAGKNELPADWPTDVPSYSRATVQFAGSSNQENGKEGAAAVLTTKDSPADVIAFYKAELTKLGWTVQTTMDMNGGSLFSAIKDDRAVSIAVAVSEGETGITIGVGKQ